MTTMERAVFFGLATVLLVLLSMWIGLPLALLIVALILPASLLGATIEEAAERLWCRLRGRPLEFDVGWPLPAYIVLVRELFGWRTRE